MPKGARPPKTPLPDEPLGQDLRTIERDILEGYETSNVEALGVNVDDWIRVSRSVAMMLERAKIKRQAARYAPQEQRKELIQEASRLEETQVPPLRTELIQVTIRIVEIFAEEPRLRENIRNWAVLPLNLRPLIRNALQRQNIDVSGVLARLKELEDEEELRQTRSAVA